jgi:hypothetical protein
MMFVPHWEHRAPLPGNGDSFTFTYLYISYGFQNKQQLAPVGLRNGQIALYRGRNWLFNCYFNKFQVSEGPQPHEIGQGAVLCQLIDLRWQSGKTKSIKSQSSWTKQQIWVTSKIMTSAVSSCRDSSERFVSDVILNLRAETWSTVLPTSHRRSIL